MEVISICNLPGVMPGVAPSEYHVKDVHLLEAQLPGRAPVIAGIGFRVVCMWACHKLLRTQSLTGTAIIPQHRPKSFMQTSRVT